MSDSYPFPKVNVFLSSLPLGLIKRLRQIVEAGSPADTFACYCNLFEWLANYLANLCNSAYKECPADKVDKKLESKLRDPSLAQPRSFGSTVTGLQDLARGDYNLPGVLPELAAVLGSSRIPATCIRQIRTFKLIKQAREDYSIPPSTLRRYVEDQIPRVEHSKGTLIEFLQSMITYRNKGVGHQDEEGWFPRDRNMYKYLNEILGPAVDDLLDWESMRILLTQYEVVSIERVDRTAIDHQRVCSIARPHVADGFAPLGPSYLACPSSLRIEVGMDVVARRGERPHELKAIVRHATFPETHQTPEQRHRYYAAVYLMTYLERGLVTPAQRENELGSTPHKFGLSDVERARIEGVINTAINTYTPEDGNRRDASLGTLHGITGQELTSTNSNFLVLLNELPTRRKEYLFEQIDNNTIMSFDQLRRESELSEPDLTSVLDELEQEGRVRRIGDSAVDRAHFKAQDPTKPTTFRALLGDLRDHAPGRRRYPEPVGRLVDLCAGLLADDGFSIPKSEIDAFRLLVADSTSGSSAVTEPTGRMTLAIDGEELHADSVRELFLGTIACLERRSVDVRPAIPFLIGRTRYLVNDTPTHANGTPFAVPVAYGNIFFEANRNRDQAIAEILRFVRRLGLEATSADLPGAVPIEQYDEGEVDEIGDTSAHLVIELTSADGGPPKIIQGTTVRRFFTALLDQLLTNGANLDRILPVKAGRIRHLLSDEPYHGNGRPFNAKSTIEHDGYYMNADFSHDQAIFQACALCELLGIQAVGVHDSRVEESETAIPLRVEIDGEVVESEDVPRFLRAAIEKLYINRIITAADIPYKAGRVRYLISQVAIHDHGRAFIRPIEVYLGDNLYFVEANVSRLGAVELIQRILAGKRPPAPPPSPSKVADPDSD